MQTTTVTPLPQPQFSRAGVIWLKLAVLYLILGIALGIAMGASQNFTLRPVHAHINLLGWTTMALAGLIYSVFPKAGESGLARLHLVLRCIRDDAAARQGLEQLLAVGELRIVRRGLGQRRRSEALRQRRPGC